MEFRSPSLGVLIEKYIPGNKWKKDFYYVADNIKKHRKMFLVFLENSKNCQNECVFEVAVMGWSRCMNLKLGKRLLAVDFRWVLKICIYRSLKNSERSVQKFKCKIAQLSIKIKIGPITSSSSGHFEL